MNPFTRFGRKQLRLLALAIALLLTAAGGLGWWWLRASLPQLDGEMRLFGLQQPVEVALDGRGVPHLYAREPDDAWFAVGVVHARDRFWQMELYRRAASGRLSEMLGERTLPFDKRHRTLGLRQAAEGEWARMAPAARTALARYAEGVNAVTSSWAGRQRPLELQILGVTPEPWTPVDSLSVGRLLAWRLAENHQAEIVRALLAARFGWQEAARLAGSYPADAPVIVETGEAVAASGGAVGQIARVSSPPSLVGSIGELRRGLAVAASAAEADGSGRGSGLEEQHHASLRSRSHAPPFPLRPDRTGLPGPVMAAPTQAQPFGPFETALAWLDPGARRGASNSWVLAGHRTASGRPLLANDPHLQIEMPAIWYELHAVAAGLDVIGVTVPGAPFIVIGHNARIAWGLTNTGADVQDLVVERVDLARRRVLTSSGWEPVQVEASDIPVRGRDPERFEVWRTRNGPLFAEVDGEWDEPPAWLSPAAERRGERRAYALAWDSVGADMAAALEQLNRAGSWDEFTAALERFESPSQNVVFADVDGNIGYAMAGRVPLRSGRDGTWPVDGSNGPLVMAGHIAPALLPRALNPPSGVISSANNAIDRRWGAQITHDWTAPFRAEHLQERLAPADPRDQDTTAAIQLDLRSRAADRIANGLPGAIEAARKREVDPEAIRLLEQLRDWDRIVDARPVVAFYQAFEHALWRRTFFDELGSPLFEDFYEWAGGERLAGLFVVLGDPADRWFDDIATLDRRETRDDIYLLAVVDAQEQLTRLMGGVDDWDWSRLHEARFEHPVGSAALPLRWLFSRGPIQFVGDGTTVNKVSFHRLRPFAAYEHASWRQILDVGNWDASRVVLPAGQSGHPLSPFYFDQNAAWREGRYHPQPFSRTAVDQMRAHRLLLLP